jgi:transcription elongation factor Elf1
MIFEWDKDKRKWKCPYCNSYNVIEVDLPDGIKYRYNLSYMLWCEKCNTKEYK